MIILTGGAGFIGSNMLTDLNAQGIEDILVVDSLGSSEKWKNLVGKKYSDYCDKSEFLRRLEGSANAFGKVDAVLHLGACSSTTETNAAYVMENNFLYSKALCTHCVAQDIRFIYASSAATYGEGEQGFDDDPDLFASLKPLNIYAYSKLLFDQWVLQSGAIKKSAGLRFFNVFGPNEYHKGSMQSVVLKAFDQILESGKVNLFRSYREEYADGEQKRDFIYVRDCTEVMSALLVQPEVVGVYNLGSGKARSWLDLVQAVFLALSKKPDISFTDMPEQLRGKYQYFTEASMNRLNQALPQWKPRTLEDAVAEYVQQYLSREKSTR